MTALPRESTDESESLFIQATYCIQGLQLQVRALYRSSVKYGFLLRKLMRLLVATIGEVRAEEDGPPAEAVARSADLVAWRLQGWLDKDHAFGV